MDYKALKELVRQGEGKHIEFKLKSNHPEKIVREIVAFANTNGGHLLIGIGDDRSIQGLKYIDEDEYLLVRAIEKYCSPGIEYQMQRVPIADERDVLVIRVLPSPHRPHYVLQEIPTSSIPLRYGAVKTIPKHEPLFVKKTYIRVADKSVQASWVVREILRLKEKEEDKPFQYGDVEHKVMQYIDIHPVITIDAFSTAAGISRNSTRKALITLVLANLIQIQPDEMVDKFVLQRVA